MGKVGHTLITKDCLLPNQTCSEVHRGLTTKRKKCDHTCIDEDTVRQVSVSFTMHILLRRLDVSNGKHSLGHFCCAATRSRENTPEVILQNKPEPTLYPGGTDPAGTYPGGTDPARTYPGGTDPARTYPGGTDPGQHTRTYPGAASTTSR